MHSGPSSIRLEAQILWNLLFDVPLDFIKARYFRDVDPRDYDAWMLRAPHALLRPPLQNMQNDNPVRKWSAIQGTECTGFDMSWIVLNCFWTPVKNYPTKASCAAQVPLKPIRRGFHLLEEPTWLRWSSKIKCWCHMICNKIGLLKQNVFEWTTELVRRS